MNFARKYFYFIAVITLGLGLALLLAPALAAKIFFDDLDEKALFFARVCGSTLIGYATLNWYAARATEIETLRIAAWSNLMTLLIATILSLLTIMQFDQNRWLLALQYTVFAAGFITVIYKLRKIK